jgi:hypothetical protein
MPERVQLRRKKGWRMPANTVSVARPSQWGNPYKVGLDGDAAECVRKFESWVFPYTHRRGSLDDFLLSDVNMVWIQQQLRGKNLACWCPLDSPCHADVLLKIANDV